ncbi:aspartate/glutamate racemase family protein [Rosenbergiella australiborealis]|uniref:aspartate/glutamate racemase family protein n=1 Tax=Rosenbergiella australiborealis TaxID=1544696 RepID=UPI001F4E7EA0|nr:aspartate/glutamate racemase family protein [Rosenbergiella australiborealis]
MTVRIGVLAGMGPRSTAPFIDLLIDECQQQYGATYDIDFPEMHIISLPTPFFPGQALDDQAMVETLQRGINDLVNRQVNVIAVPCNLAHCYFSQLQQAAQGVPLLHIAETIIPALPSAPARITLLATEPTLEAGFYQEILSRAGREVIDTSVLRNKVTALIALIKAEGFSAPSVVQLWRELLTTISAMQSTHVVIDCTDLSPLLKSVPAEGLTFIDTSQYLAKATISVYVQAKTNRRGMRNVTM